MTASQMVAIAWLRERGYVFGLTKFQSRGSVFVSTQRKLGNGWLLLRIDRYGTLSRADIAHKQLKF